MEARVDKILTISELEGFISPSFRRKKHKVLTRVFLSPRLWKPRQPIGMSLFCQSIVYSRVSNLASQLVSAPPLSHFRVVPAEATHRYNSPASLIIWVWFCRDLWSSHHIAYYGILYEAFDRKYFWWQIIILWRRAIIIFIFVAAAGDITLRYVVVSLANLGALLAQALVQPFGSKFKDGLEGACLTVLLALTGTIVCKPLCSFFRFNLELDDSKVNTMKKPLLICPWYFGRVFKLVEMVSISNFSNFVVWNSLNWFQEAPHV